ncbi:MAG: hypothetical protein IJM14_05445 [Lachnospiraceae bacterium]|nr:hypothetical protein [Lachnospiraceae bacterium]
MGRGGGGGSRGGGGGHRGGGGFHTSHSSHSSFSSGRSSFHSSYHRPYVNHYHYSYPRRRSTVYYGGTSGYGASTGSTGCLTAFVVIFILMIVAMSASRCSFAGHKAYVDENVVSDQSENYYTKNFAGDDNTFLFYVAYSKALDDEYQYIRYGADAAEILDGTYSSFFDYYQRYYQDDVGLQLAYALNDFYEERIYSTDLQKIDTKESYDSSFIKDDLDWIDPAGEKMLKQVTKALYEQTGIQFQVAIVNYDKLPGAKTDNTKIFVAFIICAGVVVGIYIGYSWWKKKKAQKNKEAEDAIRILNTPLDQFNSINYIAEKYDSPTQAGTTASTGAGSYVPTNNNQTPTNNQSANDINNQIDSYTAGAKYDDDNDVF